VTYETHSGTLRIARWITTELGEETLETVETRDLSAVPEKVSLSGEILFVRTKTMLYAVAVSDGQRLAEMTLPSGYQWIGDRFVAQLTEEGRTECFRSHFNGQVLFFLKMPQKVLQSPDVLQILERCETGQLLALMRDGRLIDLETEKQVLRITTTAVKAFHVSHDGQSVQVVSRSGQRTVLRVSTLKCEERVTRDMEDDGKNILPRRWSVRSKFTHLALDLIGKIQLRAQKGYWVTIQHTPNSGHLALQRVSESDQAVADPLAFGESKPHPAAGSNLSPVEWPSGSKAWLDSRGMLHLQSADRTIPEVTIILAESTSLPAWSSDGLRIGPSFFTGGGPSSAADATVIDSYIQRFVASCR
jgi:hypothetical protein